MADAAYWPLLKKWAFRRARPLSARLGITHVINCSVEAFPSFQCLFLDARGTKGPSSL